MITSFNRPLLALAGLCGAAGVALAAAGQHGSNSELSIAANFLLFHAPALIGLSLLPRGRALAAAAGALIVGLLLFCGDLVALAYFGHSPFPLAAPIGGLLLILGWLLVAATALFGGRTSQR